MIAEAPGGLGDVDHQVGAALQLVGDTKGGGDEPYVSGIETSIAEECEALVLDGVAQGVDGVVVVDDLLRARRGRQRAGHRCRRRSRSS